MIYLKKGLFLLFNWIEILFIFFCSMSTLRDEMYTRQTHIRDRFAAKPAVVTYN